MVLMTQGVLRTIQMWFHCKMFVRKLLEVFPDKRHFMHK